MLTLVRQITCAKHAREGETLKTHLIVCRCADRRCRLGFARDAGIVGTDSSAAKRGRDRRHRGPRERPQNIANANGGTRAAGDAGIRRVARVFVQAQLDATVHFNGTVQQFTFDLFRELAPAVFQRISPDPLTFGSQTSISSRWTTPTPAT